jgi:hypothetical protein
MDITAPVNWPLDAPEYNSLAGWEYEKNMIRTEIIKNLIVKNKERIDYIEKLQKAYNQAERIKEVLIALGNIKRALQVQKISNKIYRRIFEISNKAS